MKRDTLPPVVPDPDPSSPARRPAPEQGHPEPIIPVAFSPPPDVNSAGPVPRRKGIVYLILGLVLLLCAAAWFVFSARPVHLVFEPVPDHINIIGTLLPIKLADRYLLLPGSYTVSAQKTGYHDLEQHIEVTDNRDHTFKLQLEKLPGLLSVSTLPPSGARILVDNIAVGEAPLTELELAPGIHKIEAKAERYFDYRTKVNIEGAHRSQSIHIELLPAWATIFFDSTPQGAELMADDQILGVTPLSVELLQGQHEIRMALAGYKPWQDTLSVAAQQPQTLPTVALEKADGTIALHTRPQGASVTVDGRFHGQTPLELTLAPDKDYQLQFTKAGYRTTTKVLTVEPEQDQRLEVRLQAKLGVLKLDIKPEDAEVFVDSVRHKQSDKGLRLSTIPHRLEIKKQGYVAETITVTPREGYAQEISVRLKTLAQREAERTPLKITNSVGQELRLVRPGRFTMGASRREQGRRANEVKFPVALTRAFYIGTKEVTNAQYRLFQPSHFSGLVENISLEIDELPVVRVSWEQAARYCNWLSRKESLPPVYLENHGEITAINPVPGGYRLPTEAEWAWAARYAGNNTPIKYPWGDAMPPKDKSANLADNNARPLLSNIIEDYDDGFAATAPTGSYAPNPLGLFDIGGNVAEWVHDLYAFSPEDPGKTQSDPTGPTQGRFHVIRGSGWMHANISELRLTYRDYGDKPRPDLGFRIARYAQEQP